MSQGSIFWADAPIPPVPPLQRHLFGPLARTTVGRARQGLAGLREDPCRAELRGRGHLRPAVFDPGRPAHPRGGPPDNGSRGGPDHLPCHGGSRANRSPVVVNDRIVSGLLQIYLFFYITL